MAKSDLHIDILGTSITIATDEEPEYLTSLLSKYRAAVENIQRASGLKDPLKIAILTGFLLCDDLQKAGTVPAASDKESGELEQLTLGMISRLDELFKLSDTDAAPQEVLPPPTVEPPLDDHNAESAEEEIPPAADTVPPVPAALFKLKNTVKNFDWGSPEWIPALMEQKNLSRIPWAELWMGVHPAGPSRIVLPDGESSLLSDLIGSNPETFLGAETAKAFGKLPFLLKIEAVAKPLSVQAHPNQRQAQEGFLRENQAGIPLDAPNRNYRDSNHKPEIICALSPFAALCGFRETKEISTLIDILYSNSEGSLKDELENLFFALEQGTSAGNVDQSSLSENEKPLKAFLTVLFGLNVEARRALGLLVKTKQSLLERDFPQYKSEWSLCSYFSTLYPEDPGVIAPLYLNIVELAPSEAVYLPSGIPHAYVYGMGIELMADSDNVLRACLTPKHVDVKELLDVVDFTEFKPQILKVPDPVPAWFSYPAPAGEYVLSMLSSSGSAVPYPEEASSIVVVTKGSAAITEHNSGLEMRLNAGESVFIPAGDKAGLVFSGEFTAYAASAAPSRFQMVRGDADICRR